MRALLASCVIIFALAAPASATSVLDHATGLIGYWPMDTNFNDASGNVRNGTGQNGVGTGTPARIGVGAGQFDGAGDFVTIDSHAVWNLSGDFTAAGWFSGHSSGPDYSLIFGRSSGTGSGWNAINWIVSVNTNGTIMAQVSNAGAAGITLTSPTSIADTGYHHLALRRSGTQFNLFIDGVSVASDTSGLAMLTDANQVRFGWGYNHGPSFTTGSIDDVAVWGRALLQSELQSLTAGPVPEPATAGLLVLAALAAVRRRRIA